MHVVMAVRSVRPWATGEAGEVYGLYPYLHALIMSHLKSNPPTGRMAAVSSAIVQ
jgi:hypothetical protein